MRRVLRPDSVGLTLGVALMLGCFPPGAEAKMVGSLPASSQEATLRQAREAELHRLLDQEKVARVLGQAGLSHEQIRTRLGQLDNQQLGHLASHLETIQAGGDGGVVLTTIAIVVAIIALLFVVHGDAAQAKALSDGPSGEKTEASPPPAHVQRNPT